MSPRSRHWLVFVLLTCVTALDMEGGNLFAALAIPAAALIGYVDGRLDAEAA